MSTIATKEHPIIFSPPMVRAILDGRKSQTRRKVKPQPATCKGWACHYRNGTNGIYLDRPNGGPYIHYDSSPYGTVGDRLWVRESFLPLKTPGVVVQSIAEATYVCFRDGSQVFRNGEYYPWTRPVAPASWPKKSTWRPSIHMPRWASRLMLEITEVRFERLNDISHEDALAEGCEGCNWVASSPYFAGPHTDDGELPQEEYQRLWESINGRGSWAANPWVWVISFRRINES